MVNINIAIFFEPKRIKEIITFIESLSSDRIIKSRVHIYFVVTPEVNNKDVLVSELANFDMKVTVLYMKTPFFVVGDQRSLDSKAFVNITNELARMLGTVKKIMYVLDYSMLTERLIKNYSSNIVSCSKLVQYSEDGVQAESVLLDLEMIRETNKPQISIIIPVYNSADYIEECLISILNQGYQKFEIICVDDGSRDSSLQIIQKYQNKDHRIKVYTQRHAGASVARNKGLNTAIGKYIYFLDSDDKISSHALMTMYEEMEKNELDILLFDGNTFYDNTDLANRYRKYERYYIRNISYDNIKPGKELYVEMRRNGDYKVSCCVQVARREFINSNHIHFFEGIMYEDNLFSLECMLNAKRVKHIGKILFFRRVRENSTSTKGTSFINFKSYYECVKEINRIYEAQMKCHADTEVLATLLSQIWAFSKATDQVYKCLTNEEKEIAKIYIHNHYRKTKFDIDIINEYWNEVKYSVDGITVLAPTNKLDAIKSIVSNYCRQRYKNKELIIIINNDKMDLESVKEYVSFDQSISVYQLPESDSLGRCLNMGAEHAKYSYLTKLDDDDYYGEDYLGEIDYTFSVKDCDVAGKKDYYVYFDAEETLCKWKTSKSCDYVNTVCGGTITLKKKVLERVQFADAEVGTDQIFMKAVYKEGIKIYSMTNKEYIYMRYSDNNRHTWKIGSGYYTENPKAQVQRKVSLEEVIAITSLYGEKPAIQS